VKDLASARHIAESGGPFTIHDLAADSRFRENPLVTGKLGIRFAAGCPIRNASGACVGVLSVFDPEARRRSADLTVSLRELAQMAAHCLAIERGTTTLGPATHRYTELFENTTDIVFTHDLTGRITAINRTGERLTGFARGELLGKNIADLVTDSSRKTAREMLLEQFGGGGSQSYELEFRTKEAACLPVETSVHLMFQQGRPAGLMGFARDLTKVIHEKQARREAESELRNTSRRLVAAQSALRGGRLDGMEEALEAALEKNEFELRFQPQVLTGGALDGFEVLLMWRRPGHGLTSATHFVPAAEKSGLIRAIGDWVLTEACERLARWVRAGYEPPRLAVNVSTVQFESREFIGGISKTLADSQVKPGQLEIEITESSLMRNVKQSVRAMHRLREAGVRLAIDDFGTGYSSLSYLTRLPVHRLKIDRSFLQDEENAADVLSTLRTIVKLAHDLGMTVVGEGVEKVDQLRLLQDAGCDAVQGHLFGHPLDCSGVERLLSNRKGSRREARSK